MFKMWILTTGNEPRYGYDEEDYGSSTRRV